MDQIRIRGIKGGVLISLPETAWYQQRDMLILRIQTQERFFKGGRIALDVGGADWSPDQLFKLLRDLSDEGVCLWALLSTSEITLASAKSYEIQTSISSQPVVETPEKPILAKDELLDDWRVKPLEKGEKIAFKANGVVLGDVPEGSEVASGGSLIVWGTVRGSINAGCGGDPLSVIRVLRYDGTGIRLCGQSVEVPKKLLNLNPLEIAVEGNRTRVVEVVTRKFKLL
ncbi:MAG: septum site-determining protein MinC [Anaerolineaceae bacterium]|nr:septum site-determining protein MinC [Anaerolineaceae bacterium]